MNALDFLPLEKAAAADTVNDLAKLLGVSRRHIMHWRSVGLTVEEAAELAGKAEVAPEDVWPDVRWPESGQLAAVHPAAPAEPDDQIVWCDPPRIKNGPMAGGRWGDRLAPLVSRPGEWARVSVCETRPKANALSGRLRKWASEPGFAGGSGGGWQVMQRTLDDGQVGVWVRYEAPAE